MKAGADEAFRVVMEKPSGTVIFGPFATIGAAKGIATRESVVRWDQRKPYPFKLQRTTSNWEDIE